LVKISKYGKQLKKKTTINPGQRKPHKLIKDKALAEPKISHSQQKNKKETIKEFLKIKLSDAVQNNNKAPKISIPRWSALPGAQKKASTCLVINKKWSCTQEEKCNKEIISARVKSQKSSAYMRVGPFFVGIYGFPTRVCVCVVVAVNGRH
jgi:hypothetical protein